MSLQEKSRYFYEAFIYFQFKKTGYNKNQTLFLINADWIEKWKKFNYNNLEKYFLNYKIQNQKQYNYVFDLAQKDITFENNPGMIINLDIIEDFNTFFNDGNINDPFNYVVDKNNKKYLKIPKDLWNLFSENYGEDYELSSFFSEQTPCEIMFCNEKKVILEEGKIYLNSNNYKDISNRIYNIIQAGRLKSINKLNNFSSQDITIEKKQDYNKKIYFKVYIKGATKKNKNEFEILIDSKNEEEISKIMNNKDTIENSISSNSNKDNLNI